VAKLGSSQVIPFVSDDLNTEKAVSVARAISEAKKVSGPSKSLDFVPGPFRILELAPFSDLAG
jgi:hypothetical protein